MERYLHLTSYNYGPVTIILHRDLRRAVPYFMLVVDCQCEKIFDASWDGENPTDESDDMWLIDMVLEILDRSQYDTEVQRRITWAQNKSGRRRVVIGDEL